MKIWNLSLLNWTRLMLWRTGETEFRVVQAGEPSALLTNADYILIDRKLKSLIEKLNGQVTYTFVTVHDNVRKKMLDNYIELKIRNEITPHSIDNVDGRGLKIWSFADQHVFVSNDLKAEIEKTTRNEFEFTEGFSHFGGENRQPLTPYV
jgi:hypothetical protein